MKKLFIIFMFFIMENTLSEKRKNGIKKTKSFEKTETKYATCENGLNWAKTIHLYLTTYVSYPKADRKLLREKIILINGGYRSRIRVEIWFASKTDDKPKPIYSFDEKDIKFEKGRIRGTPDFTTCYSGYQ